MTDEIDDERADDDAADHEADAADVTSDADAADAAGDAMADRTCDRCGGEAVPVESGAVTLLECADCGNVLGLVDHGGPVGAEPAEGLDASDGEDRRVEEVTARDGELGQLVALLRTGAEDSPASTETGPGIETNRLLIETDRATLEVVADDDRLQIRESDREGEWKEDDRDGAD